MCSTNTVQTWWITSLTDVPRFLDSSGWPWVRPGYNALKQPFSTGEHTGKKMRSDETVRLGRCGGGADSPRTGSSQCPKGRSCFPLSSVSLLGTLLSALSRAVSTFMSS